MTNIIAITGASGFIGREVTKYWRRHAATESLGELIAWPRDILDDHVREDFLAKNQPEVIIHLAGSTHGRLDDILENNVVVVQKLLQSAADHKVKHVVFASSGAVYGNTGPQPATEDSPTHPANEYGLSKLLAEKIIDYYQNTQQLTVIILRFANVYGSSSYKGVLADMMRSVQHTGKIVIDNNGAQSRSFVHVDDAVSAIIAATQLYENHTLNIGAMPYSIQEIATLVQQRYGGTIEHKEKVSDLKEIVIDSSKAAKVLFFRPKYAHIMLGEE